MANERTAGILIRLTPEDKVAVMTLAREVRTTTTGWARTTLMAHVDEILRSRNGGNPAPSPDQANG